MQEIVNTDCPLSGTRYCRMLNMHSCASCSVRGRGDMETLMHDLDTYERLLPPGGIARLFQTHDCVFCKGKPGKRSGYAILYMAHPEPRRIQKRKLLGRKASFGTMVPLQMAICSRCRRRFLALEYLPSAFPLLFGGAALVLLAQESVADALMAKSSLLALALLLAALALGALAGWLASVLIKRAARRDMFTDVLTHPVVKEMTRMGWEPIVRQSRTHLMLSKSRLAKGLGTAEDETDGE